MKCKTDFFIWACIWINIISLQLYSFLSNRDIKRLDKKIETNAEVIMYLYNAACTNKVGMEAFIEHVKHMEQEQNRINEALGGSVAIIGKEVLKQKGGVK